MKYSSLVGRNIMRLFPGPGRGSRLVLTLVLVFFCGSVTLFALYNHFTTLLKPAAAPSNATEKLIVVSQGASTGKIGDLLESEGLIKSSRAFRLYAKIYKLDGRIKAGEYNLSTGFSTPKIIGILVKGQIKSFNFTIPEGFSLKQIGDRLAEKGYVNRQKFNELIAQGSFDYDFIRGLPEGPARLEGYLFPDTYSITKDVSEQKIIEMMLARTAAVITPEFKAKAESLGMTVHEAVTLASIIEREAQLDAERANVSAVFHNRLKKGWKLESCATVQYILGQPKARLLEKDLQIVSPYNTYLNKGLPPGPIAAPGQPSLLAAVNPAQVDYMFFVVSGSGKHVFSRTLAEHNRAAAAYQSSLK